MKQLAPIPFKDRRRNNRLRMKHAVRRAHDRMFNVLRSPAPAEQGQNQREGA